MPYIKGFHFTSLLEKGLIPALGEISRLHHVLFFSAQIRFNNFIELITHIMYVYYHMLYSTFTFKRKEKSSNGRKKS